MLRVQSVLLFMVHKRRAEVGRPKAGHRRFDVQLVEHFTMLIRHVEKQSHRLCGCRSPVGAYQVADQMVQ